MSQAVVCGKKVDYVNHTERFPEVKAEPVVAPWVSDWHSFTENRKFSAVIKITAVTGLQQIIISLLPAADFTPP